MLKKYNLIHLILLILDVCIIPIVGFISGFDSPNVFIATLCCLFFIHPIIYMIMLIIKESKVRDYFGPKFAILNMGLTAIIGCVIWYCFYHINFVFINTIQLWYGILCISFVIPFFIEKLFEYIAKKKNDNRPKIVKK